MEYSEKVRNAKIVTNLAWVMVDIMEACLVDMDYYLANAGERLVQRSRQCFNGAMHNLAMLRSRMEPKLKEQYGTDSDYLYLVMKASLDRCGEKPELWEELYRQIKSMPSRYKLELSQNERTAFGKTIENVVTDSAAPCGA